MTTEAATAYANDYRWQQMANSIASGIESEAAQLALVAIANTDIPRLLTRNPAMAPTVCEILFESGDVQITWRMDGSNAGNWTWVAKPTPRPPAGTYSPATSCQDLLTAIGRTNIMWAMTDLVAPHLDPLGVAAWSLFLTMVAGFQGSIDQLVAVVVAITRAPYSLR